MPLPGDQRLPGPDWLVRRITDLERKVRELLAGRRLEAATIGAGGLTVDGGTIRVLDTSGGSIELGGGVLTVKDTTGTVVQRLGRLPDGRYGLQAPNADGGSIELAQDAVRVRDDAGVAIVELGKAVDGLYGWRVNDGSGDPQVRAGELAAGGHGIEIINAGGQLVSLSNFGVYSAQVDTTEDRSDVTFGDLATVGPVVPDVPIGASGQALVIASCYVHASTALNFGETTEAWMGFAISGATTIPATSTGLNPARHGGYDLIQQDAGFVGFLSTATISQRVSGLNPGLHTFTAKYATSGSTFCEFSDRNLTVIPI